MKRTFFTSIMSSFMLMMVFGTMLTFSVAYLISAKLTTKDIQRNGNILLQAVDKMYCDSNLTIEEIAKILSNNDYRVVVLPQETEYGFDDANLNSMLSGDSIFIKMDSNNIGNSYRIIDNKFVCVRLTSDNNLMRNLALGIGIMLTTSLLVSFIIMCLVGKKMLNPLKKFSVATNLIANGDFSMHVDVNKASGEVKKFAEHFNEMIDELRNTEVLKKDFISNVSHEFKTPLATIDGFAEVIRSGKSTPEENVEYAQIIGTEARRLSILCSNILRLSGIEQGKTKIHNSEFYLDEQIRNAVILLESQWSKKNINLEVDLDQVLYNGDEELMHQVWMNIIGNAIKFTPENGTIGVTLYRQVDEIYIVVSDNGMGMSEDVQAHIFEKFYQGDTSHATRGNGLGLALVKQIIDMSSGKINVKSAQGSGTTFTIILKNTKSQKNPANHV